MQEMMDLALTGEDEEGVGMSKTIDFRGMAEMEWACKVMHEYEKGKFTKTADCRFTGRTGAGKKKSGELLEEWSCLRRPPCNRETTGCIARKHRTS